jgi:ABC-type lipoprotein export system ATPase subunit
LIATHNASLAPRLDRVLEMADGRLIAPSFTP